jgi:nitrogen regulatory protein PII
MVEGEAMSDWEYSPMENIAFALQDIANTLERIEKLMPVPGGEITTSEILVPKVEEVVEVSTTEEDTDGKVEE